MAVQGQQETQKLGRSTVQDVTVCVRCSGIQGGVSRSKVGRDWGDFVVVVTGVPPLSVALRAFDVIRVVIHAWSCSVLADDVL